MLKIILATGNHNKVRELQHLLGDSILVEKSLAQPEVNEYGASCAANAIIKAQEYFAAQGNQDFDFIVADDSGIFVPYLGENIPGVKSARFSYFDIEDRKLVPHARDIDVAAIDKLNNVQLLRSLEGVPFEKRTAYFYSALALLDKSGRFIDLFEGLTFGHVDTEMVDAEGWGYDHLFISDTGNHWGKTSEVVKNQESHRYKASLGLCDYLKAIKS
ncbi:MAG: hypothetical protein KDD62_06870 [Bdellovibrionales bacterium]|nr:hypothetical protein [Bdellovibrionales bacterium]